MKKSVKVRNVLVGEGRPKICVPLVGRGKDDIFQMAEEVQKHQPDLVEWRGDWFESIGNEEETREVLRVLRDILKSIPILFTFRTAKEGGEQEISDERYVQINCAIAESKLVDLIDVECFRNAEGVEAIVNCCHKNGIPVIMSNHDFEKTPEQEEILRRLILMQEKGADIAKIAVMPQSAKDVLTLLGATEEMASQHAEIPIVTMSMSETGLISRIAGETFGSSITFGAVGKVSAPGQMEADQLAEILEIMHASIKS